MVRFLHQVFGSSKGWRFLSRLVVPSSCFFVEFLSPCCVDSLALLNRRSHLLCRRRRLGNLTRYFQTARQLGNRIWQLLTRRSRAVWRNLLSWTGDRPPMPSSLPLRFTASIQLLLAGRLQRSPLRCVRGSLACWRIAWPRRSPRPASLATQANRRAQRHQRSGGLLKELKTQSLRSESLPPFIVTLLQKFLE